MSSAQYRLLSFIKNATLTDRFRVASKQRWELKFISSSYAGKLNADLQWRRWETWKKRTPATPVPSLETQTEAMKIAKATQKPGQTKEQTKLIAQGIEKGIAQYKKTAKRAKSSSRQSKEKNNSVKNCASMKKMLSSQTTSRMIRQTTPQVSCLGRYLR